MALSRDRKKQLAVVTSNDPYICTLMLVCCVCVLHRSPCFSVATNILIVSSPTVPSLIVRRLLMPFSSTPWHSGEAAALADMFKNDPAAYSVAKSRIEIVSSIMQIVCPLIGARLAAISLRLPWAVCGMAFSVMIAVSYKCVHYLYCSHIQYQHRLHRVIK